MSRSETPDLVSGGQNFEKDSKGIYIVLTTNNTAGAKGDWADRTAIWEIKKRLKTIMHILPTSYGGIHHSQIDGLVDSMVHFKRTGTTDDGEEHNLYSHSKIVCVDRKLMYVGSDNAYPCYNEEHGIWVEDQMTINTWLDGFFINYWEACKTPLDLAEPKKA
jgi:hypothetical protein